MKRAATLVVGALLVGALLVNQPLAPAARADDQSTVNQIQSQLDDVGDQLVKAKYTADAAKARYNAAVDKMSDLEVQAENAEKDVESTKVALDEATDRIAQIAVSSGYMGSSMQQLGTLLGANGIDAALRDVQALEQVSASAGDTQNALRAIQNQAKLASERQQQIVAAQRNAIDEMNQAKVEADAAVNQLASHQVSLTKQRDELIAKIALAKKIAEEKARQEQAAREAERARQIEERAKEQASRSNDTDRGAPPKPTVKPSGKGPSAVPAAYRGWVGSAGNKCSAIGTHIIAAQIHAESGWNPRAVSYVGAQGLAQFMPGTWAAWGRDYDGNGRTSAFDPGDAIMTQADYMCALYSQVSRYKQLGKVSGDTMSLTLAAYNAGSGNVLKYGGVPPFGETKAYISRIKNLAATTYR